MSPNTGNLPNVPRRSKTRAKPQYSVADCLNNESMVIRVIKEHKYFSDQVDALSEDLSDKTELIMRKQADLTILEERIANYQKNQQGLENKVKILEKELKDKDIEKSNRDREKAIADLELRLEREKLKESKQQVSLMEIQLEELEKQALPNAVIALVASILLNFGVNIVPLFATVGWLLILVASLLSLIPFVWRKRRKL